MKWWHWLIIGGLVAGLLAYWQWRSRQKDYMKKMQERMNDEKKQFTEADAKAALVLVAQKHGKEVAKQVEQVARWESNHFKSMQYKLSGTGGMEAHGSAPTYGWNPVFFANHPSYLPVGTFDMKENDNIDKNGNPVKGKVKTFVIMPSVEAWMMFLADYAKRYAGNGGITRWYSTDKQAQAKYLQNISSVTPKIVNQLA